MEAIEQRSEKEFKDFFNFWGIFFTELRSRPQSEDAALAFKNTVEITLRKENTEIVGEVMQN
jgi:hypothetical protein